MQSRTKPKPNLRQTTQSWAKFKPNNAILSQTEARAMQSRAKPGAKPETNNAILSQTWAKQRNLEPNMSQKTQSGAKQQHLKQINYKLETSARVSRAKV